jgi:hypothetical protein
VPGLASRGGWEEPPVPGRPREKAAQTTQAVQLQAVPWSHCPLLTRVLEGVLVEALVGKEG